MSSCPPPPQWLHPLFRWQDDATFTTHKPSFNELTRMHMEMVSHCNAPFPTRRRVDDHPSAWVRHYGVRALHALDELPVSSIPSGFRQNIHRSAAYYAINARWDMTSIPEETRHTWLSHMWGFRSPRHRPFLISLCQQDASFWDICVNRLWAMDGRSARAWLKILDIDHAPGFHMLGTAMQLLQDQYINPQHPVHAALKKKYPTWFNDVRNAVAACDALDLSNTLNTNRQKWVHTFLQYASMPVTFDVPNNIACL